MMTMKILNIRRQICVNFINVIKDISGLISSSEVDAIEVYDNKRSKQTTWIFPLLMIAVNLGDFLANKLIIAIISTTVAAG